MNVNQIGFNNFKAFGEKIQMFSKKPITLIYGPNSIGKSSLIHMMAYRQEIFKSNFSPLDIYAGDTISINGFSSFVHKKESDRTIHWKEENNEYGIDIEIGLTVEDKNVRPLNIVYKKNNSQLVKFKYLKDDNYEIDVNFDHPLVSDYLDRMIENKHWDTSSIKKAIKANTVNSYTIHEDNFLFLEDKYFLETTEGAFEERDRIIFNDWSPTMEEMKSILGANLVAGESTSINPYVDLKQFSIVMNMVKKELDKKFHTPTSVKFPYRVFYFDNSTELSLGLFVAQFVLEMTFEINKSLKQRSFYYFGPLRHYPERDGATIKIKGGEKVNSKIFWEILTGNEDIRKKLNVWLSNDKLNMPYEIVFNKIYDLSALLKENKDNFTREDLENLTTFREELLFRDKRNDTLVHHRDMGLGVTQILPIIALSMLLERQTIGVEQPELHLHPKIQAEIADDLIRSCKENGNEFLIETHSEHILLRIMKRMRYAAADKQDRDTSLDLTPDDVCVIYVDNNGKNTTLKELKLSKDGTLLDYWPDGFFDEDFDEVFS